MSATIDIIGFAEPTDDYKKKYAAFKALQEADISIPKELWEYFGNRTPAADGMFVEVDSKHDYNENLGWFKEIDVKSLPANVTKIRVQISY